MQGLFPISDGQLTIDATAGGIAIPAAAITGRVHMAVCYLSTAPIRVSYVTAPTAALGIPVTAGNSFEIWGQAALRAFRAFRTTGTSGVIDYQLWGDA